MRRKCDDSAASWIFLFIGIIASLAMRLVVLFMHLNPFLAKAAWYVGISFFLVFFLYRYNVSRFRARSIEERSLVTKISDNKELAHDDRETIGKILCSLTSKKERINFAVIFILSGIALLLAISADFFIFLKK